MAIFRRLVVFLGLLSICFAQQAPPPRKCPDVPIKTTDGKTIRISQYHDKVVLIAMFSTVCDHCLATLEFMARLQNEMVARGLQVVAISLDDSAAAVAPFAERYRFPFPVGHLTPDPALGIPDVGLGDAYPDPTNIPPGCRFHPRCPSALAKCATTMPDDIRKDGRLVECLLAVPA